jgi:plastocyanin
VRARRFLVACLVLVLGAAAYSPRLAANPDQLEPPLGPTRLLVRGEEFNLLLSQLKVNPGDAIVQFVNAGEDPHDLQIQRRGDSEQFLIAELPAGEIGEIGLRLRRDSRYVMWCSLADHRELGMEASMRVRRKKR